MRVKLVSESLQQLNEKSHVRRASNKFENINDALSELYNYMTQSDKNLKDKIFHQYYRFYNDGDIFRFPKETLKKLGMSEEGLLNLEKPFTYAVSVRKEAMRYKNPRYEWIFKPYEKGLEEAAEVVSKYLLKKYGKKLDRQKMYLNIKIEIYNILKDYDFKYPYWIEDYGVNFNIPELIDIANEIRQNKENEKTFNKNENKIKSLGIGKTNPNVIKLRVRQIIEDDIKKTENKLNKNES